jgi:L-lactate dehydrogenase complex protein LldG
MTDLVELFVANCERNGLVVHRGRVPALDGAEVSQAIYALADPGSVCIACSPEEPRTRSLLPAIHVAVVAEDRILPDLAALFRALGRELPSSLAIVSGPSRSADIEQQLALGVHGPREQHVAIVAPASRS